MEDKDDKQYEATQKKLDDTRKKGQTSRSKELSNFITLFFASIAFLFLAYGDGSFFLDWFEMSFTFEKLHTMSEEDYFNKIKSSISSAILLIFGFSFLSLVGAMIGNLAIGGWVFAVKNAAPKLEKLNPIKGFKKIFSMKTLVELLKSIIKLILLSGVGFFFVRAYQVEIFTMSRSSVEAIGIYSVQTTAIFFFLVTLALILVVVVDAPYQLFEFLKNQRMSHKELKDEHKNSEGDPHVKGKIREAQRRVAMGRMMEDVPTADVVVTNPTHYSVALKYDESKHNAPIVVASGVDTIANRIKEIAKENTVPVIESPELARSLFKFVDVGTAIPTELYEVVAQVIMFVSDLEKLTIEQKQRGLDHLEELSVPNKLKYSGVKVVE